MCIKILIYMIDNQQVKSKISIIFSARSLRGLGGGRAKNGSKAGSISGEVVRPAYPSSPHDLIISLILL